MENEKPKNSASDEIDLGQLFQIINKGLKSIFRSFLRLFLYLKKNSIILGILLIVGLALGYGLKMLGDEKLKTDVIVKPNFNSKNYLYDVVDEIQNNIRSGDTLFFENIGLDVTQLQKSKIGIEPVEEKTSETSKEDMEYLELLLTNFKGEGFAQEIVKSEITKKSEVDQRITFYYVEGRKGNEQILKILSYINNNEHYKELGAIYRENLRTRIENNKVLISQIDELISNYSKGLADRDKTKTEGAIYLDNESSLNIPGLLNLKTKLGKEIEDKKIELTEQKSVIKIINLGKSQKVKRTFFRNTIFVVPGVLICFFFLISILKFLNGKTKEM